MLAEKVLVGRTATPAVGHVRTAFGTSGSGDALLPGQHVLKLNHIVRFLQQHVAELRSVLRASATKDAALAFLVLLDQAGIRSPQ